MHLSFARRHKSFLGLGMLVPLAVVTALVPYTIGAASAAAPGSTTANSSPPGVDQKVNALLGQMTLERSSVNWRWPARMGRTALRDPNC